MKITLTQPFPGFWQAADEDTLDASFEDGRTVYSGMYATARTRHEALMELRDKYEELEEYPSRACSKEDATEAIRRIDALDETHTRVDQLLSTIVEIARPVKP